MASYPSLAALVLRLAAGGLMMSHGWDKLIHYSERSSFFPDPIGLGPSVSMALAVFSEFFCALAVALGLLTRAAVIPLMVTMFVAAFVFHGADPLAKKELALFYFAAFTAILCMGPGRFSLDSYLLKK